MHYSKKNKFKIQPFQSSLVQKFLPVLPQKDKEDQWLEKKVQGNKDHIILEHLQWTMGYEVQITAANRLGYSEPTVYEFSMPPKPNIIKGKQDDILSYN